MYVLSLLRSDSSLRFDLCRRASAQGHVAICKVLVENGADAFAQDASGHSSAHHAAANGHLWTLHFLLTHEKQKEKFQKNRFGGLDHDGRDVMYWACVGEHLPVVKYLIARGWNVNFQDAEGNSCLHYAVKNDRTDLAKLLVEFGAKPNLENAKQATPLDMAKTVQMRFVLNNSHPRTQVIFDDQTSTRPHVLFFYAIIVLACLFPTFLIPWFLYLPVFLVVFLGSFYRMLKRGHSHGKSKEPTRMHPQLIMDDTVSPPKAKTSGSLPQEAAAGFWLGWAIAFILFVVALATLPEFHVFGAEHQYQIFVLLVTTIGMFSVWIPLCLCKADPGMIRTADVDFPMMLQGATTGYPPQFLQHCTTCMISKPERSKHCRVCNICIARMDHHCIWINNCVGYDNHRMFMVFLFLHWALMVQYVVLSSMFLDHQIRSVQHMEEAFHIVMVNFLPVVIIAGWAIFCTVGLGLLLLRQLRNISRNVTENESINWKRYAHMHERDSTTGTLRLANRYDVGCCANVKEWLTRRINYYETRPLPMAASV